MIPALFLSLSLAPGVDVFGGARKEPLGPKAYPSIYIPAPYPSGYLYEPAIDLNAIPRGAAQKYVPKAGDILLLSDPDPLFNVLYVIGRSGRPGHSALVVTMPDGRPGMLEDGFSFTPFARVTPLDYGINLYAGHVWVRQRTVPLTPEEDRRLTEFAMMADGGPYDTRKYAWQLTFFRSRNPIVTRFVGKPVGPGQKYTCIQIVIEALVYAGLVDGRTARPKATYAQDLFYDRARNPYIDRHPPLAGRGWGEPQLWTPVPGTVLRGRERPKPGEPWPWEGGAFVVNPISNGDGKPPVPTIVQYVPGDTTVVPPVAVVPKRIGYLDRPYRLLSRRR